MTEAEWLTASDPMPMLESLRGIAAHRKLRLFAVACCRPYGLFDERCRTALEAAERFADGQTSQAELTVAFEQAGEIIKQVGQSERPNKLAVIRFHSAVTARMASWDTMTISEANHAATSARVARSYREDSANGEEVERTVQSGRLRDIFGNPFRPVAVDPSWLTSDVRTLTEGIYQERAFDRMPILADALMDAGCTQDDILDHCRRRGEHVRGCWAIDLLTGRK